MKISMEIVKIARHFETRLTESRTLSIVFRSQRFITFGHTIKSLFLSYLSGCIFITFISLLFYRSLISKTIFVFFFYKLYIGYIYGTYLLPIYMCTTKIYGFLDSDWKEKAIVWKIIHYYLYKHNCVLFYGRLKRKFNGNRNNRTAFWNTIDRTLLRIDFRLRRLRTKTKRMKYKTKILVKPYLPSSIFFTFISLSSCWVLIRKTIFVFLQTSIDIIHDTYCLPTCAKQRFMVFFQILIEEKKLLFIQLPRQWFFFFRWKRFFG